jgi:hypothetical protein
MENASLERTLTQAPRNEVVLVVHHCPQWAGQRSEPRGAQVTKVLLSLVSRSVRFFLFCSVIC